MNDGIVREHGEAKLCNARLSVFIADESSMICTDCDWIGWPRQTVEPGTGRVLKVEPHPYTWYPWLHER